MSGFGKKAKKIVTKKDILSKITTYDIYRHYFGPFKLNHITKNHLRGEKSESFIIGNKVSSNLTHKDFGNFYWRGDAFQLVEQIYNCDFMEAMIHIDKDMGLGILDPDEVKVSSIVTWKQPLEKGAKPPPDFKITVRPFNNDELKWWSDNYSLDLRDLKIGDVYAPRIIRRNNRILPIGSDLVFCYWYPEIEKWKIYRPEKPKKKLKDSAVEDWKWDSNVTFNYCDNLHKLKYCDLAIVAKSRKDRLVLTKALGIKSICDVQAEDPACLKPDDLEFIKSVSKRQVVVSDNDDKGKEFSWWLTKEHGFKHCNVPDIYLEQGITDFADMVKPYGLDAITKYFQEKQII